MQVRYSLGSTIVQTTHIVTICSFICFELCGKQWLPAYEFGNYWNGIFRHCAATYRRQKQPSTIMVHGYLFTMCTELFLVCFQNEKYPFKTKLPRPQDIEIVDTDPPPSWGKSGVSYDINIPDGM